MGVQHSPYSANAFFTLCRGKGMLCMTNHTISASKRPESPRVSQNRYSGHLPAQEAWEYNWGFYPVREVREVKKEEQRFLEVLRTKGLVDWHILLP